VRGDDHLLLLAIAFVVLAPGLDDVTMHADLDHFYGVGFVSTASCCSWSDHTL
jgi:hypothetical protein